MKADIVYKNLNTLEKMLKGQSWVAGDHVTIADHSILSSLTVLDPMNFDFSKWTNIHAYIEQAKSGLSYWDECYEGVIWMKEQANRTKHKKKKKSAKSTKSLKTQE